MSFSRIFVFLILLILGGEVKAQTYSGIVIDAFSKKPMVSVSVVNITTGYTTITGTDGKFSLPAHLGELIQFSYVGYSPKRIQVPNLTVTAPQIIQMDPADQQLGEFIFKEKYTPYQLDSMYRKSTYAKDLNYSRSGGVFSPVSLLAETISGKNRNMKAFKQTYSFWEEQHFIDSRYTPLLISEQTGLQGDSVALFKNQFPMPYDYARTASIIEIKMWIRNNFKQWRKEGSPVIKTTLADSLLMLPPKAANPY